jgi:hypothetical protein
MFIYINEENEIISSRKDGKYIKYHKPYTKIEVNEDQYLESFNSSAVTLLDGVIETFIAIEVPIEAPIEGEE